MEGLLNAQAEGRIKGLAKWYALAHAAKCSGCRRFLEYLEDYLARARDAKRIESDPEAENRLAQGAWRNQPPAD